MSIYLRRYVAKFNEHVFNEFLKNNNNSNSCSVDCKPFYYASERVNRKMTGLCETEGKVPVRPTIQFRIHTLTEWNTE